MKEQCAETIDLLYAEYRKHHSMLHVGVLGLPATDFFGVGESSLERKAHGGAVQVDWASAASASGWRFVLGASGGSAEGMQTAGGRIGAGMDLGPRLFLRLTADGNYLKLTGPEDDRQEIPFTVRANLPQGGFDAQATESAILFEGAAFALHPQLDVTLYRARMRAGNTVGVNLLFGYQFGYFVGSLSDEDCHRAFDPSGEAVRYIPGGNGEPAEFFVKTDETGLCREAEGTQGYFQGLDAGVRVEYVF